MPRLIDRVRFRTASRHRLAWLLWLALLLPIAQFAGDWHRLSHANPAQAADGRRGKPALHPATCDLCVLTAAIGGGPLPAAELTPAALSAVRHEPPRTGADGVWTVPPPQAYRSRAPPLASL